MRILRWILPLVLTSLASAQFTTVTGTVTDPNSLPYANGTITATLVTTATPTIGGLPYTPPSGPTGLDGTGSFTIRLADNNLLLPAATTWTFHVCSATGTVQPVIGAGPVCFDVAAITIAGASQSISVQLTAAAVALTVPLGGGGGNVSGAGTANKLPIWTAAHTLGDSPLTYNGSTTVTTSKQFALGGSNAAGTMIIGTSAATACAGASIFFNNPGLGCAGSSFSVGTPAAGVTSGTVEGVFGQTTDALATTFNAAAMAGVYGFAQLNFNGHSPNFLTGVAGFANSAAGTGTPAYVSGLSGMASVSGAQVPGKLLGGYFKVSNETGATTLPFGAGVFIDTPVATSPFTQIFGVYQIGTEPNSFGGNVLAPNLPSATMVLPNGTSATTQIVGDNTTKVATDAFVLANALTNPMSVLGDSIRGGAGGAATVLPGPTGPNSVPQSLCSTPSGGVATAQGWCLGGVPVDATNPATLLVTDRANYINWTAGTALALPAVATTFASNLPFVIQNNTAASLLTITPNAAASDLIDGASTGTLSAKFAAFVYQDATTAPGHWFTVKFPTSAIFPIAGPNLDVPQTRRSCDIVIGDTSGSVLVDAQLGPQAWLCYIPAASTLVEMTVSSDGGTPSVVVAKYHKATTTTTNLTAAPFATSSTGTCVNVAGSGTALDGTTCATAFANTTLAAGDYINLVSGTAGGVAKMATIHLVYTVN